jgi:large subunit ribosomal protein L14e
MVFKRFVQTGRIVFIAEGPSAAIVDVIDHNRVLVDGPESGVPRRPIHLNNVHLTRYRIKFAFTSPTRIVRKAWTDAKINEKFLFLASGGTFCL